MGAWVAVIALSFAAALDAGTSADVIAEARELVSQRYVRATNLAIRKKLRACVDAEPKNADCWKLLATVYAKGSRTDKGDEARAVAAYKRYVELVPPATEDPPGSPSPMGDWGDP